LINSSLSIGQTQEELNIFDNVFEVKQEQPQYTVAKNNHNELQFVMSGFFLFYKTFISSQDLASCVFYPSCSVYALESVKKKGFFFGTLNAFDRLSRCNPFNADKYPIHKETQRLYDPVQ
jgi:putative membrane protein insertion efficiency factor